MIKELLDAIRAAGIEVDDDVAVNIEMRIRQQFGGERVYVPKAPKRVGMLKVEQFGTMSAAEISKATGMPVRTVRYLRSGR